MDPAQRQALVDQLKELGGFFGRDVFHLPGDPTGIGLSLNALVALAGTQGKRGDEAEQLIRQLVISQGSSPPAALNAVLGTELAGNPFTTSSDALFKEAREVGQRELGDAANVGRQQLRDTGAFGRGPAGLDAQVALESNLGRASADMESNLILQQALNRAQDLSEGSKVAGRLGETQTQLQAAPQAALAQFLATPEFNPAQASLIALLQDIGAAQSNKSLANKGGTLFEAIAPLLGSAVQSIGTAFAGAPVTNLNLGG